MKRTKIAEHCPNFRACEELVNHTFDGHILALCMDELKVETIDALAHQLRYCDVALLVERVYARGFALGLVHEMREESGYYKLPKRKLVGNREGAEASNVEEDGAVLACEENSDVVLENAILFMQVVGVYRELCDAIQ